MADTCTLTPDLLTKKFMVGANPDFRNYCVAFVTKLSNVEMIITAIEVNYCIVPSIHNQRLILANVSYVLLR